MQSFDEALLRGFLARLDQLEADRVLTPVITLDRLLEFLDDGQRVLVEQVIGLRPSDYGVDTPYAGDLEPVPSDLVTVSGQQYAEHGERRPLGDKYVPRHVFEKYTALNDASKAAIDFKNVDGSPSDTDPGDFAYTAEYAWLREHAARFRFYESWPPGNEFGMRAEPWHWQYRPLPHE